MERIIEIKGNIICEGIIKTCMEYCFQGLKEEGQYWHKVKIKK